MKSLIKRALCFAVMADFGRMIIKFMKENNIPTKGGTILKNIKKLVIAREGPENERYFTVFSGLNENYDFNTDSLSKF
ncbi:hypothetical protein J4468_03030 [Candidatus Woesearchaeota archaeon]|nr:hypothetical protein [Candidatus Woesearchaeota archaeon]